MSDSKQKFNSLIRKVRTHNTHTHTHTHTLQKFHLQVLYMLSLSAIYC